MPTRDAAGRTCVGRGRNGIVTPAASWLAERVE